MEIYNISDVDLLKGYIKSLQEEVKEKDAMIDFLAQQLGYNAVLIYAPDYFRPEYERERDKKKYWRERAQEEILGNMNKQ